MAYLPDSPKQFSAMDESALTRRIGEQVRLLNDLLTEASDRGIEVAISNKDIYGRASNARFNVRCTRELPTEEPC